ncbi:unnamed protein product [Cunninghamella blakesleeana]
MTTTYSFRGGKRLVLVTIIVSCLFLFAFQQGSLQPYNTHSHSTCHNTRSLNEQTSWKASQTQKSSFTSFLSITEKQQYGKEEPYYLDLNDLNATSKALERQERILVLTPLLKKNAIHHLKNYFDLLDKSTYPNHLISVALLISRSSDDDSEDNILLVNTLYDIIHQYQDRWFHKFNDVTVYQRDFHLNADIFSLQQKHKHLQQDKNNNNNNNNAGEEEDDTIPYQLQPYYRSVKARARNFLLTAALKDHHSWVSWIDVDVVDYPNSIFEDLIHHDVDVIVPNCLLKREDGQYWAYDRNNWQESDHSIRFQQYEVGHDFVMLEGYKELATGRHLLVDMPTHLGKDYVVPLDGVGATFTLVKAQVHREGANFPSFPYQHQVDTEGFARMVKAMGYNIFGIPGYFVYHA